MDNNQTIASCVVLTHQVALLMDLLFYLTAQHHNDQMVVYQGA